MSKPRREQSSQIEMKTYTVEVRETILHEVTVKEKSKRAAVVKAEHMALMGECCFHDATQCGDEGVETKVVSKQ